MNQSRARTSSRLSFAEHREGGVAHRLTTLTWVPHMETNIIDDTGQFDRPTIEAARQNRDFKAHRVSLRFQGVSSATPSVEAALQVPNIPTTTIRKELCHTGTRCLVGSSTE